jgi:hypothetical protein
MIEREQLAEALAGVDARDREVLDYSLRRRVPDEDLSSVFGVDAPEVARMRAGAVERLSSKLGVQRGEDLGHMLRLLLETATWDLLPAAAEPAAAAPAADEPAPEPPPAGHRPVGAEQNEAPPPPEEPVGESSHEPVLGMLADSPEASEDSGRRSGGRRLLTGLAVALAVLAPAGMVAALTGSDGDDSSDQASEAGGTKNFQPQSAAEEPFPTDARVANRYPIVRVRKTVKLLDAPGGRFKVKIGPKTEFKTGRVLSIVKRRGEWLAVLVPELDNGQVAWINQDQVSDFGTVPWAIHVDLSKRQLIVRKDGKEMRKARIGIGRTDHPTPRGRFAVTDKLKITRAGSPYGCCVLALTGHQTKLPPGWPGGDRLAVHATANLAGLGKQVSLGCMRSDPKDASWMLKHIPLGTPVFIRA